MAKAPRSAKAAGAAKPGKAKAKTAPARAKAPAKATPAKAKAAQTKAVRTKAAAARAGTRVDPTRAVSGIGSAGGRAPVPSPASGSAGTGVAAPASVAVPGLETLGPVRATTGVGISVIPGLQPSIPARARPGAEYQERWLGTASYAVTISGGDSGMAQDGTLYAMASNLPYVGIATHGNAVEIADVSPPLRLRQAILVFADDLAGRIEQRVDGREVDIVVGQRAALLGPVHHLVQSERPIELRVGLWVAGNEIEVTQCDVLVRQQSFGQRES